MKAKEGGSIMSGIVIKDVTKKTLNKKWKNHKELLEKLIHIFELCTVDGNYYPKGSTYPAVDMILEIMKEVFERTSKLRFGIPIDKRLKVSVPEDVFAEYLKCDSKEMRPLHTPVGYSFYNVYQNDVKGIRTYIIEYVPTELLEQKKQG